MEVKAMSVVALVAALVAFLVVGGSQASYSSGGAPSGSSSTSPDISTPTTPDISTPSTPDSSSPPYSSTPSGSSPVTVPDTPSSPSGGGGGYGKRSGHGTCKYWKLNTRRFPNIISLLSTVLRLFGGISSSRFGSKLTVVDALSNESNDGYSALARHGVASLLNSYTVSGFAYTPEEVRQQFNAALTNPELAAKQALAFEKANELV